MREFEKKWIRKIEKELLKKFPEEFIVISDTKIIELPQKALLIGSEFFGNYEVVDSEGNCVFSFDNIYKAKYVLYANRFKPKLIHIPNDEKKIVSAVKEYERLLDSILREIERDFKTEFPESKFFMRTSANIFLALNLQRY